MMIIFGGETKIYDYDHNSVVFVCQSRAMRVKLLLVGCSQTFFPSQQESTWFSCIYNVPFSFSKVHICTRLCM